MLIRALFPYGFGSRRPLFTKNKKQVSDEIYALKVEGLNEGGQIKIRVFSETPLSLKTFPLLIEMRAGNTSSMKSYDVAL
ncbi:hypothetical protein EVA_09672, partial [gut metagenome]